MNDLRAEALRQAAIDEKHSGGSSMTYFTPNASYVVIRAQAYLKFLLGQDKQPAPKKAVTRAKGKR